MAIWSVVLAGQGGDAQPGQGPNASSMAKSITAGHFSTASTNSRNPSFDDLIGELLEMRWYIETNCRGTFQIDYEIEPLRTLYRQLTRFCPV